MSTLGTKPPVTRGLPYEEAKAIEKEYENRRVADLDALVERVIFELGGLGFAGLEVKPRNGEYHYPIADVLTGDGAEITFTLDKYGAAGRLAIGGHLIHPLAGYKPYGVSTPSISVAEDRPSSAIAKEIARRLLPGLFAAVEAAKAAKVLGDDYDAKRDANVAALVATGLFRLSANFKPEPRRSSALYAEGEPAGFTAYDVNVGDAEVEIKSFRLPAADAVAVVEFLKARAAARPAAEEEAA